MKILELSFCLNMQFHDYLGNKSMTYFNQIEFLENKKYAFLKLSDNRTFLSMVIGINIFEFMKGQAGFLS